MKPCHKWLAVFIASVLVAGVPAQICPQQPVRVPKPITEAQARQFIQDLSQVQACGDPVYTFDNVQIGQTDRRTIQGRRFVFYPVHARYHVACRYYDDSMRVEVDLKTEAYLDDFGKWAMIDPGFGDGQNWDTAVNGVRCRAQSIARLTTDKQGNVTGSAPVKDQSFIDCVVMAKNGN